jgi:hypothetical protein
MNPNLRSPIFPAGFLRCSAFTHQDTDWRTDEVAIGAKVAAEMALSVLVYDLTRVTNIVGIKPLIPVIVA